MIGLTEVARDLASPIGNCDILHFHLSKLIYVFSITKNKNYFCKYSFKNVCKLQFMLLALNRIGLSLDRKKLFLFEDFVLQK